MARADLICDIIKYGLNNDYQRFVQTAEAISAEERTKQHSVLAERIDGLLKAAKHKENHENNRKPEIIRNGISERSFFSEKSPERRISDLVLPDHILEFCRQFTEEQLRADLLRSYGLEPRNKVLFIGEPGNGKTSLAEALAESLLLPFYTVRYEQIIGSYLGETASRLARLFDYVRTRPCVLFFDEFDTLGKERGDTHDTGEIKRVVSSLLLQIDSLPSYVVVIAATNHDSLLDNAAWRRFQIKVELPRPSRASLEKWFSLFERRNEFDFGIEPGTLAKRTLGVSFAEAEELALSIYRQYVLHLPLDTAKRITEETLSLWKRQTHHEAIVPKEEG
jgi:SpoVK/Ycf46/Vps4 family AAA+-type ATPase